MYPFPGASTCPMFGLCVKAQHPLLALMETMGFFPWEGSSEDRHHRELEKWVEMLVKTCSFIDLGMCQVVLMGKQADHCRHPLEKKK